MDGPVFRLALFEDKPALPAGFELAYSSRYWQIRRRVLWDREIELVRRITLNAPVPANVRVN